MYRRLFWHLLLIYKRKNLRPIIMAFVVNLFIKIKLLVFIFLFKFKLYMIKTCYSQICWKHSRNKVTVNIMKNTDVFRKNYIMIIAHPIKFILRPGYNAVCVITGDYCIMWNHKRTLNKQEKLIYIVKPLLLALFLF
jgi:hypothetical protein